jgi:hypothetical protein
LAQPLVPLSAVQLANVSDPSAARLKWLIDASPTDAT